jgi:cell division protein FtsB
MAAGSLADRRSRSPASRRTFAAGRVRWDRLGRVAMALVALALLYLYVSAGVRMLSTIGQARSDSGAVAALERENVLLTREHEALGRRNTLEEEARKLGMSKRDEVQYLVSGLPDN